MANENYNTDVTRTLQITIEPNWDEILKRDQAQSGDACAKEHTTITKFGLDSDQKYWCDTSIGDLHKADNLVVQSGNADF